MPAPLEPPAPDPPALPAAAPAAKAAPLSARPAVIANAAVKNDLLMRLSTLPNCVRQRPMRCYQSSLWLGPMGTLMGIIKRIVNRPTQQHHGTGADLTAREKM